MNMIDLNKAACKITYLALMGAYRALSKNPKDFNGLTPMEIVKKVTLGLLSTATEICKEGFSEGDKIIKQKESLKG